MALPRIQEVPLDLSIDSVGCVYKIFVLFAANNFDIHAFELLLRAACSAHEFWLS